MLLRYDWLDCQDAQQLGVGDDGGAGRREPPRPSRVQAAQAPPLGQVPPVPLPGPLRQPQVLRRERNRGKAALMYIITLEAN
eukprot:scaffold102794_cov42-Prasinocladus_malaysianus.AAC.2